MPSEALEYFLSPKHLLDEFDPPLGARKLEMRIMTLHLTTLRFPPPVQAVRSPTEYEPDSVSRVLRGGSWFGDGRDVVLPFFAATAVPVFAARALGFVRWSKLVRGG